MKNLRENTRGGIDCDIDHPEFGMIAYTLSDKEVEEVKAKKLKVKKLTKSESELVEAENIIREAKEFLDSTNHQVLELLETGQEIPSELLTKRAEAREKIK